jgi:hypothetical protein
LVFLLFIVFRIFFSSNNHKIITQG